MTGQTPGRTPEQIEADIERQRSELAGTVTELQAKLDVKTRVRRKVDDLGGPPVVLGAAGAVLVLVVGLAVLRRRR